MSKDVIILKCKECGEEFLYEYSGRGAKPIYCPECRKKVTMRLKEESKKKWQEKKSNLKKQLVEMKQAEEESVVSTNSTDYEKKLIDLLSRLDTLRVDMCNFSTELRQYQSGYDKNDQVYIHTLENMDTDDVQEVTKFVKEWKKARNNRRSVKDLICILSDVINVIPFKSVANAMSILNKESHMRRR